MDMKSRRAILAVLIIAIAASVFVYVYLVLPQAPFSWDESHHSTFSLLIAKSILQKNWKAFWHYTNSQVYWPFLHSWISSIFLMLGANANQWNAMHDTWPSGSL